MALDLNHILSVAVRGGASDIHLKAGLPPMFRVNGSLLPLRDAARITPDELKDTAYGIMNENVRLAFETDMDADFGYGLAGVGRFRVNLFQQRGTIGMVLRVIPYKVQELDSLLMPPVVSKLAEERRGLILVTGATGSGKSTTLAAIVEYINATRTNHIVTVEDPMEFLLRDRKSIINQREIGSDTKSFAKALRAALRQDPDVILVGEMRDPETMEIALKAAETGHLVLSTLHTTDAAESVNRIVTSFEPHMQSQTRVQLASLLRGVISQRLVPRIDGRGRVPAVEVLVNTARVKELVLDGSRFREFREAIAQGHDNYGMQTFDQSLLWLYHSGYISLEEALHNATNPDDFKLRVSGIEDTNETVWGGFQQGTDQFDNGG